MDGTPVFQKEDVPETSNEIHPGGWDITFYTINADETYIYLVYSGKNIAKYNAESGLNDILYPNRLLVIDWEGNFIYDITLDHGVIFATLDKKRKRLICDTKDFDNYLVSYDLSGL